MKKILLYAFIILIIWALAHIRITNRTAGIAIQLPQYTFYIALENPKKVYIFNPHPDELRSIVESNVQKSDAKFGIFIKNLSTGQEFSYNAEEQFTAASLYKLAVMYTLYNLDHQEKLNVTQSDIKHNLQLMISRSSNDATYYLVDKYTSWGEITKTVQAIGLKNTTLNQNPPLTTPQDMAYLLETIAAGKAIDLQKSVSMLELLVAQQRNDRIPVLLPPGVTVAHKTGELADVRHDAGVLIGPDNDIILILMSKESSHPESVKPIMAQLSFEVYEFFRKQWANPPEIL